MVSSIGVSLADRKYLVNKIVQRMPRAYLEVNQNFYSGTYEAPYFRNSNR